MGSDWLYWVSRAGRRARKCPPLTGNHSAGIKFTELIAVDAIDLRIIYRKGAPIAYVRPLTKQGRHWLWDHVKYPYVGVNAIVQTEQLLDLIHRMDADELTIHWQS